MTEQYIFELIDMFLYTMKMLYYLLKSERTMNSPHGYRLNKQVTSLVN